MNTQNVKFTPLISRVEDKQTIAQIMRMNTQNVKFLPPLSRIEVMPTTGNFNNLT